MQKFESIECTKFQLFDTSINNDMFDILRNFVGIISCIDIWLGWILVGVLRATRVFRSEKTGEKDWISICRSSDFDRYLHIEPSVLIPILSES